MRLTAEDYEGLLDNENVQRALASIRAAEGTSRRANPYGVGFGFTSFDDYSDHPGTSKSFRESSGRRNRSTAAGAYQHLERTWDAQRERLGLKDFSPRNQDISAVSLIDQAGALDDVLKGDVRSFARKVSGTWASMPASRYDQPKKSYNFVEQAWRDYAPTPKTGPVPKASPYGPLTTPDIVAASSLPAGLRATTPADRGARVTGGLLANVPTPTPRPDRELVPTVENKVASAMPDAARFGGYAPMQAPRSYLDRYAETHPGVKGSRVAPQSVTAGLAPTPAQEANLRDRLGTFGPVQDMSPSIASRAGQIAAGLLGATPAAAATMPATAPQRAVSGFAGVLGSPRSQQGQLPAGALGGLLGPRNVPTPIAAPRLDPITQTRTIGPAPQVAAVPDRVAVATPTARPSQPTQPTSYAPQAAPAATPTEPTQPTGRTFGQKAAVMAGSLLGGAIAGPVGGLLGGALANSAVNRGLIGAPQQRQTNGYANSLPDAPDRSNDRKATKSEMDRIDRMNRENGSKGMSQAARDAANSGKGGFW